MTKLKEYKMFINGEWVDSDTKKTFETLNPENNKPWAIVPEASANDVDKAVQAAQKAFEGEWPKLLPRERGKFLRAIGNKLRENAELLGKIETIDTGKLFRETKKQANYIAEYYDYYAGLADKVEGTVLPIDKPNIQAITTRIPIGVIAAIMNRVDSLGPMESKRTRGELVLEALDHSDASESLNALIEVEKDSYRGFNMFIADNVNAYWIKSDESSAVIEYFNLPD